MFDYVLAWLITFGIAFSLANTDGPLGWFDKGRKYAKRRFGEDSWQNIGVNCPICLGCWIGIPVALFLGGGFSMWLSSLGFVTVVICVSPE